MDAEDIKSLLEIALPIINPTLSIETVSDAMIAAVQQGIVQGKMKKVEAHAVGLQPLAFGKHKNKSIAELYASDPTYLKWFITSPQGTADQRAQVHTFLENVSAAGITDHHAKKRNWEKMSS